MDLLERLQAATEGSSCIEWPRAKDKRGRGRIWCNGKLMLAHRWVWEKLRGPIPEKKLLCHHCDNPSCVNPHHLYVGTHADNMRDMSERKRTFVHRQPERAKIMAQKLGKSNTWCRGEGNPRAKLTKQQVELIRKDSRETRYIAAEYGVDRTTVQRIKRGILWRGQATALKTRRKAGLSELTAIAQETDTLE